jgi:hypothetical protein
MSDQDYPSSMIRRLIDDACTAEEIYGLDELEEYADLINRKDEMINADLVHNEGITGGGERK